MKSYRTLIGFLILFFLFGLSRCAVTDFDRSADFSSYTTYAWGDSEVEVSNPLYDSDLINKRIRNTVEKEFQKRGIVKDESDPDFIVLYRTFTEEKEKMVGGAYPYGYRFYPYAFYPFAFGWWYPYNWTYPPEKSHYTEGTLIIDIVDNGSDELVWRGSVTGDVDPSALKKQIEKGVKAIMKKYPVTPDDAPLDVDRKMTS